MTITNQPVQIPVTDGTTMQAYLAQPSTDHGAGRGHRGP